MRVQTKRPSTKKGFTLLEMLVVIAIIGLLASIMMLSVSRARQKARDVRRLGDTEQLQKLLELYAHDHQEDAPFEYPSGGNAICSVHEGDNDICWVSNAGSWIPSLILEGYATVLPQDPRGFPGWEPYRYLRSKKYGYILSFKMEVVSQQDECHLQGIDPVYSTRCGRVP